MAGLGISGRASKRGGGEAIFPVPASSLFLRAIDQHQRLRLGHCSLVSVHDAELEVEYRQSPAERDPLDELYEYTLGTCCSTSCPSDGIGLPPHT